MAKNVTLTLQPLNGAKIVNVVGSIPAPPAPGGGITLDLCSLQYGQSRDVVLRMLVPANFAPGMSFVKAIARFRPIGKPEPQERAVECSTFSPAQPESDVQFIRLAFVDLLAQIQELAVARKDKQAAALVSEAEELARLCADPRAQALLQDVTGQVREALTRTPTDFFAKWGKHYLPSLARAHLLQVCNNFKDPGVQYYGGSMFQRERDDLDATFCKLPAPKPSRRNTTSTTSSSSSYAAPAYSSYASSFSMSTYNNVRGGCFAGDGVVRLENGDEKSVAQVRKGDRLLSAKNSKIFVEVLCVVKTHCVDHKEDLVTLPGGLKITPYHPVFDTTTKQYRFPINVASAARDVTCDAVYTFILCDDARSRNVVVNGVECITLAHGIKDDAVASHAYFGTNAVVNDLRKMRGWAQGFVELFPASLKNRTCVVREEESGRVCGLVQGSPKA